MDTKFISHHDRKSGHVSALSDINWDAMQNDILFGHVLSYVNTYEGQAEGEEGSIYTDLQLFERAKYLIKFLISTKNFCIGKTISSLPNNSEEFIFKDLNSAFSEINHLFNQRNLSMNANSNYLMTFWIRKIGDENIPETNDQKIINMFKYY